VIIIPIGFDLSQANVKGDWDRDDPIKQLITPAGKTPNVTQAVLQGLRCGAG
jgi:hypothetical protein